MSAFFIHSWGHLIHLSCVQKTVFLFPIHCGLPLLFYSSSSSSPIYLFTLWLSSIHLVFPSPSLTLHCLFSPFCALMFQLFFVFFYQFFSTVFITSNSLSPFLILLPSHFISISPTLLLFFTLSLQWGHSMNNSKALQDDNGKLEVRLCVACVCVCVCKISWFIRARRQQ